MISILIGAITIGLVAGMPFSEIVLAVNDGIGNTLKGIALLVGLGSMFGAIFGSIWRCSDTGCNHGQRVWGWIGSMGAGLNRAGHCHAGIL